MSDIKFGTDGWRAIIAKEFTVDNVARVAQATASWMQKKFDQPSILIGYDFATASTPVVYLKIVSL